MSSGTDEGIAGAPGRSGPTQIIDSRVVLRQVPLVSIRVDGGTGDEPSESERFAGDEIIIGSQPGVDVVIDDSSVSRQHVALRPSADGWLVCDLASTNGTFCGPLRIERVHIDAATTFRLGRVTVDIEPCREHVETEMSANDSFGRMIGRSESMRQMFAVLERVAPSDLTVLVEGETGTGKELAAEGLHEQSGRSGPFVVLNCGAIPKELIESELVGHVKGAFTGATTDRDGAFVAADGGTLFLDEIGELPLDMQAKLLRVLEQGEVKAVGSDERRVVDVRVVAATNRRLETEVAEKRFRQDLYYRLAVVVVRIPPLRARPDDVPLLVERIHGELERRNLAVRGQPLAPFDAAALSLLERYDFPGNVRELRNIVERWTVLGPQQLLGSTEGRPGSAEAQEGFSEGGVEESLLELPYHEAKEAWIERFDRSYVERIVASTGGNVSAAARDAGVDRRHLQRLMARLGIDRFSALPGQG